MAVPLVLLTADDYAMTEGVSRAIEDLADRSLLSATGVMVNTPHWIARAARIRARRDQVAIGLHLNLTLGAPLGAMPRLAPNGVLPPIGALTRAALLRGISIDEVAAETARQLDAFEAALGFAPDFVDGHQHAHALPAVRQGVLTAITRRCHAPLVRVPAGRGSVKGLVLSWLAAGFGDAARRAGLIVNDSFGGVTDFAPEAAARDLAASLQAPAGRLHIAMCHPGFPDEALAAIDPVTTRRRAEYDALLVMDGLEQRIWHPRRALDGPPVDWQQELSHP